jgi:hypothetical protein
VFFDELKSGKKSKEEHRGGGNTVEEIAALVRLA